MIQADFGDYALKPLAPYCRCARLTAVFIDDHDTGFRPPQGHGPLHQTVWQPGRLLMMQDLLHGRWPSLHDGETLEGPRRTFLAVPWPRITAWMPTHVRSPPLLFHP